MAFDAQEKSVLGQFFAKSFISHVVNLQVIIFSLGPILSTHAAMPVISIPYRFPPLSQVNGIRMVFAQTALEAARNKPLSEPITLLRIK